MTIPTINQLPHGHDGFEGDGTTAPLSAIACPEWCVVAHDEPGAFHAGRDLLPNSPAVRLFQADTPGAGPGVVVAGQWLNAKQAHNLGMELIGVAEVVRRARREAH